MNTSVHLPDALLRDLDRAAKERGISRNKLIVEACEKLVANRERKWPKEILAPKLSPADQRELDRGCDEMMSAIRAARRSRRRSTL